MYSSISGIFKSFTYHGNVFVKGLNQRALNITIDTDVILKPESESFSILSEYMKVDRGILDMISFFRVQVPINAHLSVAGKKDMVKVLDKVMSTGFTANSCICEKDLATRSSSMIKTLNIVKVLSTFPTQRHVFILSDIEELVFLKFLQGYIKDERSVSFFEESSFYKKWTSYINFKGLKKLQVSLDALFLKSDALSSWNRCRSYILNTDSMVCSFDDYLDIAISFVISKILSVDKFIFFLKYAHDHFGESIEDIFVKISPLLENGILKQQDLKIFKIQEIPVKKNKKFSTTNYLLNDNPDFIPGFLQCFFSSFKDKKDD